MEKIFCLLWLICIGSVTYSQILPGGKQIALSHADIARSNDVFALFSNPGGLAQIDSSQAGLFFSPSPFGLTELQTIYAAAAVPLSYGTCALGAMHYGFSLYEVTEGHVGFGIKYKSSNYFGLSVNLKNIAIQNYGNAHSFQLNAGFICQLSSHISWGTAILNISQSTIGPNHDILPSTYITGLMAKPVPMCEMYVALQKESNFIPSVNVGLSFSPIQYITLLSGYSTYPQIISCGATITYSFLEFDYALTHHLELGFTQQMSLILKIGELGI